MLINLLSHRTGRQQVLNYKLRVLLSKRPISLCKMWCNFSQLCLCSGHRALLITQILWKIATPAACGLPLTEHIIIYIRGFCLCFCLAFEARALQKWNSKVKIAVSSPFALYSHKSLFLLLRVSPFFLSFPFLLSSPSLSFATHPAQSTAL